MTNRSLNWMNEPFLLRPAAKDYLWGGNRLNEDFSKGISVSPLAETWECSANPDGASIVASGRFEGMDLTSVLKCHPELLGKHHKEKGVLPILVKLIDAKEDLSIQVHPDDAYALQHENGQPGKTELWYVLAARKHAQLIYGLQYPVDRETLRESILQGTVEKYLQRIPVKKNDLFFVQPGTIHAICAGTLLAEIQQNSNITYRLYDYNRLDRNGEKRPLHIEKALDVIDYTATPAPRQPVRLMKYERGCASEILARCKYFQVERLLLNTESLHRMVEFCTDELSFQVLLCVEGCGSLVFGDCTLPFFKGDCFFIPANSTFRLHGRAQILKTIC
ncbi:MAG: class I mannose-6-phosphate isomerase [Oscillospiraceae bacterium]|nr:class I mannose-6-phosphate isomerase [Oscillospiraceae bacterium]